MPESTDKPASAATTPTPTPTPIPAAPAVPALTDKQKNEFAKAAAIITADFKALLHKIGKTVVGTEHFITRELEVAAKKMEVAESWVKNHLFDPQGLPVQSPAPTPAAPTPAATPTPAASTDTK